MTSEELTIYDSQVRELYERQRPFTLHKPRIFPDGNRWCALLGDNIQEGVAAFGKSPDEASRNWDKVWYGEEVSHG